MINLNTPVTETVTIVTQTPTAFTNIEIGTLTINPDGNSIAVQIHYKDASGNTMVTKTVQFADATDYTICVTTFAAMGAQLRFIAMSMAQQAGIIPVGGWTDTLYGTLGSGTACPTFTSLVVA